MKINLNEENSIDADIIKELNKCKTIDEVDAVVDKFKGYRIKCSEHSISRNETQITIFVYRDDPLVWQQTFTEKLNKVGDNMSTKLHLEESFDKYDYFKDIRSIIGNTVMDSKSSKDEAIKKLLGLRDQLISHVKIERDTITMAGTDVLLSIKSALDRLSYNLFDDKKLDESIMVPTPTPYKADFTSEQIEPLVIFALFGEENKPLLSNRGVIITSKIGEDFEQTYANSLYRLIKNLKDVYVIDNETYYRTKDFRTDEDFYEFVKKHGVKLEFTAADFVEPTQDRSIIDDTDFLIKMINN